MILDENMTILDHISWIPYKCYYQLRQIRRVRKSLSAAFEVFLVLVSVHSRLDYCNSVLGTQCLGLIYCCFLLTCTHYHTPIVFLRSI